MNHRLTAYLLLLIVSVIWGVAGPVIKFTLGSFPPIIFLTYRFALASAFGVAIWAIRPPKFRLNTSTIPHIILHSIFTVPLSLGLLFLGFDKTSSLTGSVISATGPIMVAIAGVLFLKEHITKAERVGIGLALLGTLIVTVGPMLNGNGQALTSFEGNLLIIGALVADAVGTVIAKVSLRDNVPAMALTNISFMIGFIAFLPFLFASYSMSEVITTITNAPLSAHLGVLYMAFLSGTLAYTFQKLAMKSIEIGEVAVFNYLFPIWAAPLSLLWLGEKITTPFVVGATVIATGVVIAEHKRRQKRRRHRKK
ncbi:DMT family transporter [Candidatus Gottesmanbacteria bacterium]|nr:DMT family transporter [Candidatus Gottesmanbacteria bacterium]